MKAKLGIIAVLFCGIATLGMGMVSHTGQFLSQTQRANLPDTYEAGTFCAAQLMQWEVNGSMCEGPISSASAGSSGVYASDTTSPTVGSAMFTCTSTGWSRPTNENCYTTTPSQCSGGRVSWGSGCSGMRVTGVPGTSVNVENTMSGYTGLVTYMCRTDGIWEKTGGTCATLTPNTQSCPSKILSWIVNGSTCEGLIPSATPGTSVPLPDATFPTTGSATFTCGTDGTWSTPTNTSCTSTTAIQPTVDQVYCPLTKPSSGYLFDFTKGGTRSMSDLMLVASNGESDTTLSYGNISIPAGIYKIDTATYWNSSLPQTHPYQQWKLVLSLTDNRKITSSATEDQSSASASVKETVATNLTIPVAAKDIDARHAAYPQSQSNSVVPLCATLTYVGPLPTVPPPTATSTKIDGACDTAKVTCVSGDMTNVGGTATEYLWYCKGVGGGTDAPLCRLQKNIPTASSTPIHGICGIARDTCTSGTYGDASDTTTEYQWKCRGISGGTDAPLCNIKKPTVTSTPTPAPVSTVTSDDTTPDEDDEEKDILFIQPTDIGVAEGSLEVSLPKEVIEQRQDIISRTETQPFTLLRDASPSQREEFIRSLIQEEGVDTDNDFATRTPWVVTRQARENVEEDAEEVGEVKVQSAPQIRERSGLATIRDSDGDDVSDYDEEHIYGTDPHDPFTADGALSDGERILLGLDPHTDAVEPVVVESPRGKVVEDDIVYSIETIEFATDAVEEAGTSSVGIRIRGTAQPLAFVTLYIYSTPIIVTVQADTSGTFEYVFDTTLEDGTHEMYVASVNNSGKILAQSNPIPFVKTAQAIEYTPASVSGTDPVDSATQLMLTLTFLVVMLLAGAMLVWIGMRHPATEEQENGAPHETINL